MPTYGYECTTCAFKFEVFHSMNSTDPRHCPKCQNLGKKLLSATSIIFKGSGFYTTDYRDSGYVEAQKRDSKPASSGSSSSPATETAAPAKTAEPSTPAPASPTVPATPAPAAPPAAGPAKPTGSPSSAAPT